MPQDNQFQQLILDELQSLRSDFNEHARSTGERLAALEVSVRGLAGNGRPGRVDILEGQVQRLNQWKWHVIGIATGVSGVATILFRLAWGK